MERPKSAKHNIERLRKSAYLNKLNLINNRHFNNNSTNTNYTVVRSQDDNIDDLDDDDYNSILTIRRKEQRLQASKSAYIGGLSAAKQRPQSARHNLDKYRNDILLEKQKKLELIQKIYNQQNNPYHDDVDAHHTMNVVTTPQDFIKNNETNNSVEAMFPNDDIDNLDGLLIREEEDSSSEHEADYIDYKSNNVLTMNKKSKQNNKLLSRRIIETKENTNNNSSNANNSIPNQMRLYRENTMNHTSNKKIVPALKDTETNVIYPTNINNINNNEIRSLLIQEKKQSISSLSNFTNTTLLQRPASGSTNTSNLIRTINTKIPSITTNLNKPKEELEATTTGLNTIDSAATNSSSSSTCSSTSSSVTASSKLNQPQIIHLNQLSSNSNDSQTLKQTKLTKNSLLSQELLNEWYKNDEEVDIRIEATKNMPDYDSTDYIEFDNTHLRNNTKNQQLQQRNVKSNLQKQSILLALNAGRTSRFSDYSSCSNKTSLSNLNKINTKTNGYLSRERTNNSMDPWTKRNPTLVAQNVLIKHRAELEQLAARHNSNSRASNHSGLLATSNNKFVLPDTKYFKKNNF